MLENMEYYVNKGIQFEESFRHQIAEFLILAALEEEYWDTDKILGSAFVEGIDAFCSIPERGCEYIEELCGKAWLHGYRFGELDCLHMLDTAFVKIDR